MKIAGVILMFCLCGCVERPTPAENAIAIDNALVEYANKVCGSKGVKKLETGFGVTVECNP